MDLAKVDLVKIREKSGFSEHVCETPDRTRMLLACFEKVTSTPGVPLVLWGGLNA